MAIPSRSPVVIALYNNVFMVDENPLSDTGIDTVEFLLDAETPPRQLTIQVQTNGTEVEAKIVECNDGSSDLPKFTEQTAPAGWKVNVPAPTRDRDFFWVIELRVPTTDGCGGVSPVRVTVKAKRPALPSS